VARKTSPVRFVHAWMSLRSSHTVSSSGVLAAQGELYIIDVSQSVDLEHPHALHFLREDIAHVNAFFRRAGVATLTTRSFSTLSSTPPSMTATLRQPWSTCASWLAGV
jgi:serine/threonine-protein kinase RIO1